MNFYVTLPSNSSMDLYPNNTLSNYTIQLKKTIKFDVPYEVALVEMIYSYRIQHEVGTIIIRDGPITDSSSFKFAKIFYKDGQNYVSFIKSIENQIVDQLALKEYIVDAKKK